MTEATLSMESSLGPKRKEKGAYAGIEIGASPLNISEIDKVRLAGLTKDLRKIQSRIGEINLRLMKLDKKLGPIASNDDKTPRPGTLRIKNKLERERESLIEEKEDEEEKAAPIRSLYDEIKAKYKVDDNTARVEEPKIEVATQKPAAEERLAEKRTLDEATRSAERAQERSRLAHASEYATQNDEQGKSWMKRERTTVVREISKKKIDKSPEFTKADARELARLRIELAKMEGLK